MRSEIEEMTVMMMMMMMIVIRTEYEKEKLNDSIGRMGR